MAQGHRGRRPQAGVTGIGSLTAALALAAASWQTYGNALQRRRHPMAARIRHIALCVKDIDATADFYEKAFGLSRTKKHEGKTAWSVYMSDGEVNLALLQYKSEVVALGAEMVDAGPAR